MNEIVSTQTDETTGRGYSIYTNGLELWKDTGKIKKPAPSTILTREKAIEIRQQGKDAAMLAQFRGLAAARGLPIPEDATLDEIMQRASSTVEALTTHMATTFMSSKNLRGMAEGYGKLIAPFVGDQEKGGAQVVIYNNNDSRSVETAAAIAKIMADVMKMHEGKIIDGVVKDVPKGETT